MDAHRLSIPDTNPGEATMCRFLVLGLLIAFPFLVPAPEEKVRTFTFGKDEAGARKQLATEEDLKADAGKWHTLTIRMSGEKIECLLNGKKHLETKDNTFAKAGKVGLWTKADAQTYFDNLQVTGK